MSRSNVVAFLAVAGFAQGVAFAQPVNNACGNASNIIVAANSSATVNGTTVGATNDSNAGNCGSSNATPDVWYSVTAPANGTLTAETCSAASYDTVVGFRTSPGCPGTALACDDDACGVGNRSQVSIGVTAGTSYRIRVSGFSSATGTFTLRVTHAPPAAPPNPSLGPDVVVNQIVDVARWGTDAGGTITAYSVGTDSCNIGDYPVLWVDQASYLPDFDSTQHPVIGQNLYRLKSYGAYSRFEHLGQSWLKHGFVSTNSGACGTCTSTADRIWRHSLQTFQELGGDVLALNCSDTYGAGLNGSQGGLGAKSIVNPARGTSLFIEGNGTGDANTRSRLQVPTTDVASQPPGTRFYVDGQYVTADDAQFVRPGQGVAFNAMNNLSWREVDASTINGSPTFAGATIQQQPGIFAWKAADASVTLVSVDHDDEPNPCTGYKDPITNGPQYPAGTKTIRSRYWVAGKATNLGANQWRYEYAVFNLNSDRGANSVSVAYSSSAPAPTSLTFHAPQWHSGEPYSNAPWTGAVSGGNLAFSTAQAYVQANDTANAMRWGQLFNFGFTSSQAPTTGPVTIGLFKPGTPTSIAAAGLPVPTVPPPTCAADLDDGSGTGTPDGSVDISDLLYYLGLFDAGDLDADLDDGSGTGTQDGSVDISDLLYYLGLFEVGC